MAKTLTPPAHETAKMGSAQIIERCGAELLRLAEQRAALETAIARDTEEIARIAEANNQRAHTLAEANKILAGIAHEADLARNYAQHAIGTLNEASAVKHLADLERSLSLQRASVTDLETKTTEAQAQADERAGVCRATIEQARRDLADGERQRRSAEQAIEQARCEHGELVYREVAARIEAHQADIANKKRAVVDTQLQLEEYLRSEALAALSEYSEHRRTILDMLPVEDAISLCFQAELAYIDTLLDRGRELPHTPLNIPAATHYPIWRALLAVPDNEVWNYETLSGNPKMLRRRRQLVSEALAQWTARLRQQQK